MMTAMHVLSYMQVKYGALPNSASPEICIVEIEFRKAVAVPN